ncbi:hypothetical protein ACFLSS_01870 [Bacteroidota bacterium]
MLKYYKYVNYGSIIIIAVLLLLVVLNMVPISWFLPFLIISLVLLVIRIIFRGYFIYQSKNKKAEDKISNLPNEQTED